MPRYLLLIANDEHNDAGEGVAAEYVGAIKELHEQGMLLGGERPASFERSQHSADP